MNFFAPSDQGWKKIILTLDQAEPQAAYSIDHEEIVPFRHRPGVLHPLEDLFLNVAFNIWITFYLEYLVLVRTLFRLAPEAHRASIDRSSPCDIYRHVDSEFVPMHGDIFQPVLRCDADFFILHVRSSPYPE